MTHEKKTSVAAPKPFGLVLLMVVFLILCLFTFAAISIAGAQSDYANSRKRTEQTTAYFAASNAAEQKLAAYNRQASLPDAQKQLHFEIPIREGQVLQVSAELRTNTSNAPYYETTEWLVTATEDWESTTTLPVLQFGGTNS